MGLRLFFLPNFPGATFIQGATFIPDSRVVVFLCNEGEGKSGCKTFTLLSFKLNLHLISYPLQKL